MSVIFTPCKIGPVTLRNRTIRSAAFENMATHHNPSPALFNYHVSVSKGGVGMTTLAYASVNRSGLSFDGQLWMREDVVPALRELTTAIHAAGAKASIQLGHCGNMTHRSTCGQLPVGASGGFNLYSPTFHRALSKAEIKQMSQDFGKAVSLSRQAGFDCVEIHAGHGYLISQFLSPYTNRRTDEFGGTLRNRMRFMQMAMEEVLKAAGSDLGVVVKTNMYDGFKGGLEMEDCLTVAKELQSIGAHALVLTAGFVSKAPMTVMRGCMPYKTLAHYMDFKHFWWLKAGIRLAGRLIIPPMPFEETYFLKDALYFREQLQMPLIYVGGLLSREKMETVLNSGFEAVQMGRALLHDPAFVNHIREGQERCNCKHSNYCIGRMYSKEMQCHHQIENLPLSLKKEIARLEAK
ncbi:MAG: NADH:flavin oxidoreductase [Bacteroidales bacterium]|nr:NADH:flavin oxidoreductase [Bacteroidales bacterium]